MSCPITLNGIELGCKDSVGGVKRVYILSKDNLLTAPIFDTDGKINTLVYDKYDLYEYDFRKQTGMLTSTESQTEANDTHFYTTDLALKFNKLEADKALEIHELAKGELIIVVLDNNGKYWYLGLDNGVTVSASVGMTGTNYGDRNGYEITFQDISKELPSETFETVVSFRPATYFLHYEDDSIFMDAATIEDILVNLVASGKAARSINFTVIDSEIYSNWTSAAISAKATLISRGWTVTYNV